MLLPVLVLVPTVCRKLGIVAYRARRDPPLLDEGPLRVRARLWPARAPGRDGERVEPLSGEVGRLERLLDGRVAQVKEVRNQRVRVRLRAVCFSGGRRRIGALRGLCGRARRRMGR